MRFAGDENGPDADGRMELKGPWLRLDGGNILPGVERTEFNSDGMDAPLRSLCGLRQGRGLGISFRRFRRPGCDGGKPGQDPKIKCRHAFLFNGLHLQ